MRGIATSQTLAGSPLYLAHCMAAIDLPEQKANNSVALCRMA